MVLSIFCPVYLNNIKEFMLKVQSSFWQIIHNWFVQLNSQPPAFPRNIEEVVIASWRVDEIQEGALRTTIGNELFHQLDMRIVFHQEVLQRGSPKPIKY